VPNPRRNPVPSANPQNPHYNPNRSRRNQWSEKPIITISITIIIIRIRIKLLIIRIRIRIIMRKEKERRKGANMA
jgi:hypothetical protein